MAKCHVCEISVPDDDQAGAQIDDAWVTVHNFCLTEIANQSGYDDDYERFTYA